ncbi:hypothetical protein LTR62_003039 [Meristemomyces frigidus]|uniref:Uncharacterized protein n=1 Tax=Meristemomyces frigidus TaxID=1508187 RepID=A0AAN7TIX8_9PEZI|nr:hypothetical protein LTR62_003039 [Meristemomyces frigidus]
MPLYPERAQSTTTTDALLEAELAQMARERLQTESRTQQPGQATRYADDQLQRDAHARARYLASLTSTVPRSNIKHGQPPASPSLTRPSTSQPVIIHNQPSSSRRTSSFREQGEAVIAREQMRDENPSREITNEHSGRDRRSGVEYLDDEEVQARLQGRDSRKAGKERERSERRRRFWGL